MMDLDLRVRIKWQIIFRSAFLMAMGVSAGVLHYFYDESISPTLVNLLATGFGFSVISFLALRSAKEKMLEALAWAEIVWDILYASLLVYLTGGLGSIFLVLYALQILAAGGVLSTRGSVGATIVSALTFLGIAALSSGYQIFFQPTQLSKILLFVSSLVLIGGIMAYFFRSKERLALSYERTSTELKDLGHLHRAIVDHIPSGILYLSNEGRISLINYAGTRMVGASWLGREIVGTPLEVFIKSRGRFESEIDLSTGRKMIGHHLTHLPDGGSVVVFQDVTELRSLEKKMILNEKMASVGQLAAGIAHEIRNPLASLSGSVQVLQSELELDPESEKLMKIVIRETDRLDQLANSFLKYARPPELKIETIQIEKVVDEVRVLISNADSIKEGRIKLTVDVPNHLFCRCDGMQLKQIFWNLLTNAIQSIAREGEISITILPNTWDGEASLRFVVGDTGEGIDDEVKKRIFDPFFTTKSSGTGLGLALVYQMVKSHDGRIGVESKRGMGSKFWFEFHINGPKPKVVEQESSASAA